MAAITVADPFVADPARDGLAAPANRPPGGVLPVCRSPGLAPARGRASRRAGRLAGQAARASLVWSQRAVRSGSACTIRVGVLPKRAAVAGAAPVFASWRSRRASTSSIATPSGASATKRRCACPVAAAMSRRQRSGACVAARSARPAPSEASEKIFIARPSRRRSRRTSRCGPRCEAGAGDASGTRTRAAKCATTLAVERAAQPESLILRSDAQGAAAPASQRFRPALDALRSKESVACSPLAERDGHAWSQVSPVWRGFDLAGRGRFARQTA